LLIKPRETQRSVNID